MYRDLGWRLLENEVAMATASARRCCAVCGVLPYIEESEGVLGGEVRVGGAGGGCPEMWGV